MGTVDKKLIFFLKNFSEAQNICMYKKTVGDSFASFANKFVNLPIKQT